MSLRASGCLPSHQVGDLVRAGAVVGSERVAVAGELKSGVEHPGPVAREALGPAVAVVELGSWTMASGAEEFKAFEAAGWSRRRTRTDA